MLQHKLNTKTKARFGQVEWRLVQKLIGSIVTSQVNAQNLQETKQRTILMIRLQHVTLTTTTTTTSTVLWPFVWDYLGEPVQEETFTHSHLSWLSIILYLLPPSTIIHSILRVQLMCLTVFLHNLSPSFLWSTSWPGTLHFIIYRFLHSIIVFFSQHMPIPPQPVLL